MRGIYSFTMVFLLSAVIVFLLANVMVFKYERTAKKELEKNVLLVIDAIQNRMQAFLGVKNDRELLSSVIHEMMDENGDFVCVKIIDSTGNIHFEMRKDNLCEKYTRYLIDSGKDEKKFILKEKNWDVFVFYNTVYGVFGGKYRIFYVLKTHIFSPLYSLKFYFNLLAVLFIFMEFLSFLLVVKVERNLAKYRETLISFEQAAMLDKLAGFLAHEIKNPLFVLSGNIELSDIEENDKKLLLSEIKRIKSIVARYESVFKKTRKLKCKPEEVLRDVERLFNTQFDKKGLFIRIVCNENSSINMPEDQFKQIAINLVLNALQANSSIEIVCRAKSEKILTVSFCSHGDKIPSNIRKRMFEPYFTTRREGTGLGLFVAKTIAEGYNGRLYYVYDNKKNCFILEAVRHENTDS